MLVQKMQISIAIIILGVILVSSGASANLKELDSIGRMPETDVTAQRYEYQDEAWLGMIEGVVVEASRLASDRDGTARIDESNGMISGNLSPAGVKPSSFNFGYRVSLLILVTVALAMLSIIYISLHAYLATEETKYDRTKH